MSTQHTPGPWTLDLGNIGIDMKNHVGVDAPDHGGIAQVVWVMDDDASEGKNTPTCEANARLIAAAPDLLEALQDALCALECCGKDYPAASKAQEAIAKATGATN
jgi:hypothetical protein